MSIALIPRGHTHSRCYGLRRVEYSTTDYILKYCTMWSYKSSRSLSHLLMSFRTNHAALAAVTKLLKIALLFRLQIGDFSPRLHCHLSISLVFTWPTAYQHHYYPRTPKNATKIQPAGKKDQLPVSHARRCQIFRQIV